MEEGSNRSLVAAGVGIVRRGSAEAVATRLAVPLDEVNPANALGMLAACPARVVLGRLPGARVVGVLLELHSTPEGPRLRVEVEVLHDGGTSRVEVEEALWGCPLLAALRPLVSEVKITVREA